MYDTAEWHDMAASGEWGICGVKSCAWCPHFFTHEPEKSYDMRLIMSR